MAGGREERRARKGDVTDVRPRGGSDGVAVKDPKNPKLGRGRQKDEKNTS